MMVVETSIDTRNEFPFALGIGHLITKLRCYNEMELVSLLPENRSQALFIKLLFPTCRILLEFKWLFFKLVNMFLLLCFR